MKQRLLKLVSSLNEKDLFYLTIIVFLVLILSKGCKRNDPNVEVKKPTITALTQTKDKKGTPVTEIKGTLYTQEQVDKITDSLKRALGKGKIAQVIEEVTPDTVYRDKPTYVYIDTSYHIIHAVDSNKDYVQSFVGNYKEQTGEFSLHLTPDTATHITTIKKHLLRPDEMIVSVYHTNSIMRPMGGYAYSAKIPKPLIDFDVFIGYAPLINKPVVAVGAGIHLFSIKMRN